MPPRGRACKLSSINRRYPDLNLSLAPDGRFRFGRHPECEQSFPKDFRISGVHATLAVGAAPSGGRRDHRLVVERHLCERRAPREGHAPRARERRRALPRDPVAGPAHGSRVHWVAHDQFCGLPLRVHRRAARPAARRRGGGRAVPAAPPEPGSPSAIGRDHAVRQTTDAPSWISRSRSAAGAGGGAPSAACATVAEAPSAAPAAESPAPPRLTSFAMWWEHNFGEQVSRA